MRRMDPLLLLILGVSGVYCDSHSLRYYYTGVSGTGWGLPEYSVVGYVDDQQITEYNSDSRVYRPVAPWMEKLGSDYWERNTQILRGNEAVYKHNVRILMSRFNQTGGLHSVQLMYGCELRDDGSTAGYDQHGYDGRDYMYLDTERARYIPIMDAAQITAQRWNSPDVQDGERTKNYLQNICIESLKRYINNGRDDLEKRVRPEVKVSSRRSGDITRLHCWVYGFHPRAVDVKWMRDGKDEVPSDEMNPILPNPDGTYQTRVTVEVMHKDSATYSCYVDHSSLEEPLSVVWDPRSSDPTSSYTWIIVAIISVVALVVVAGIAAYFLYKRSSGKKPDNNYTATPQEDDSSNSSNPNI